MIDVSRVALVLVVAVVAALGGCDATANSTPAPNRIKGMPAPVDSADRIALLVPQVAVVNFDDQPGPDGVVAQVMRFKDYGKGPKSVLVTGEVDLMVFEGSKPKNINDAPKPFFSQTFTPAELSRCIVGQYNTLWGYSLRARWPAAPRTKNIWMLARYRPPSGSAVFSSPAEQRMPGAASR